MTGAPAIQLNIVYEDDHLLVLDKPAGLVVHPGRRHGKYTLEAALAAHIPEMSRWPGNSRPGIVHRLDKDTSGLMVAAKSPAVQAQLIQQFSSRSVHKAYLVMVEGVIRQPEGVIEGPIGHDPDSPKLMAVVEGGREARTRFRVLERRSAHTFLETVPETGRTHQIRVHLAAIGYPVCGDALYGHRSPHLRRQFLHATRLAFDHPVTGARMEFSSPLPRDLQQAIQYLT